MKILRSFIQSVQKTTKHNLLTFSKYKHIIILKSSDSTRYNAFKGEKERY